MRGTYPSEMRVRVIGLVEAGSSRREAAEQLEISASSAVRWMQRWQADGTSGAKPRGGSVSPLERHAEWILTLVSEQSDLTLDEIVSAMHKKRHAVQQGWKDPAHEWPVCCSALQYRSRSSRRF
jgi:transposase